MRPFLVVSICVALLSLAACGGGGMTTTTPPPATYTIGGTITGLTSSGLVLANNGGNNLSVSSGATTFTFAGTVSSGTAYSVTVMTNPTGETCNVANGSGTATSNVTSVQVTCSTSSQTYTIGGTVSGVTAGGLVLQDNGGDDLTITANGSFTFATPVSSGSPYNVTVLTPPNGEVCTVTNGQGTATANVTNVQVACSASSGNVTISVIVAGLTASNTGLVIEDNGMNPLSINGNGTYSFTVGAGAPYDITVQTQPAGATCTVTNGSGTANTNVTVNVNCSSSTTTYSIGGTLSGLPSSATLVLQDNGGDNLSLTTNGSFTFATKIASGGAYSVTVLTQPSGGTCTVSNGSGTVSNANVTNVAVTCSAITYSIGGTVSGLTGTGLVLQDNGGDNLSITGNGSFTFATKLASGSTYNVTILTQPTGQTCTVSNGSGTASANVTNVSVACSAATYSIGGTVSGLTGSGLVLQDNGGDNLSITANGSFTFATKIAAGGTYNVTVLTQPTGQLCTVSSGSGTANANVTNVSVACSATTYSIGGTVSGLSGGTLVLQDNGADNLSITANGSFTFATKIAAGSTYSVTVLTQPASQTCTVTNGSGTANANVTNVGVTCSANTYSIGGTLSGLSSGTVVLQDNGGDNLSLSANGSFTFATKLASGAGYNVTVLTQPAGQTCSVTNGSGTVANANITNVQVSCTGSSGNFTISVKVTGLSGSVEVSDDKGDVLTFNSNTTLSFPSQYSSGEAYAVNVSSQPASQSCTPTYFNGTANSNLTLTATCATGATRALGTVSGVSSVSCKGATIGGTASCQQMTVSCPGIPAVQAYVKTNTPSGASKGTVTYGTGTDGNGLYDSIFTFGSTAVKNVFNAGFTTVQISWGSPFNNNQPAGWVEGPSGVLAAGCRYATVTQWIYDTIQNNNSLPMCATANSGGAGALAYALSQYPTVLSMAEVTSGPPTGRLDWGCGCTEGSLPVSCGATTTMGTCFGTADAPVWDPAYTPSLASKPYCTNAVNGTLPPGGLNYFLGDSAEAPGATYNLPHTYVNLVFGGADTSSAIPIGQDWFNHITNSNTMKGQVCVPNGLHSIANTLAGAQQVANDLIGLCKVY